MTETNKYILVGIDGSEISESLAQYAMWLSQSNGLTIKLVHTIEHSHKSDNAHHEGNLTPNIRRELLKELTQEERVESKQLIASGKEIINRAKEQVLAAGFSDVIAKLRHGTLPETIEDLKDEISLVMLGSKGTAHNTDSKGLGFHLEESIRATHVPVFIAKKKFSKPTKFMFVYNGSPTSKRALAMISKDGIYKEPLEVHIVCVHNDAEVAENLISEAEMVLRSSAERIIKKGLSGDTIEQLTKYQKQNNIDITAMGAYSHGKLHGFFFGSFTTKMIQQCDCNFLLIR